MNFVSRFFSQAASVSWKPSSSLRGNEEKHWNQTWTNCESNFNTPSHSYRSTKLSLHQIDTRYVVYKAISIHFTGPTVPHLESRFTLEPKCCQRLVAGPS